MGRRPGEPARRPPRGRRRDGQDDVKGRVDEMVASGIPHQMARAVATGKMELNEVLEKLAFRDKVAALESRHELSRALATQIALGQASLDRVLARRRFAVHRDENRERSCLEAFQASGEELTIAVHGGKNVRGRILAVDQYSFQFQVNGEEEPTEIHKLQAQFAFPSSGWKKVRKSLKWDKSVKSSPREPIRAPQDRYGCSDWRMFRYVESSGEVVATMLEGAQLRGSVEWFGRYEFGLRVKGEVEVTVFRHALHDLREA